jgi:hypothetical protein
MHWRRASPPGAVWREQAIAEIDARQFTTDRLEQQQLIGGEDAARIRHILDEARDAAASDGLSLAARWRGSAIERAWGKINVADEALMQVAPDSYVEAQISRLRRRTQDLPESDERRKSVDTIAQAPAITPEARDELTAVLHSVNGEARKAQTRVRSFRNIIVVCAFVLGLTAAGLGLFAFKRPELVPVCFEPEAQVVCPTKVVALTPGAQVTGQPSTAQTAKDNQTQDQKAREAVNRMDVFLIELLGTIAAALAAAAALRKARGTSTPYGVPIALAVLKLPSGALTAVLGLLFMRGGFVPGLTALDTPAQILAWAIIFGYAQELFTRMVDSQAHSVLQSAGASVPLKSA